MSDHFGTVVVTARYRPSDSEISAGSGDGWRSTATDKTDAAWKNSEPFKQNERDVDAAARAIADAFGIPIAPAEISPF